MIVTLLKAVISAAVIVAVAELSGLESDHKVRTGK